MIKYKITKWYYLLLIVAGYILFFRRMKKIFEGNYKVSSPFGERIHPVTKEKHVHSGVDYALPTGTKLISPEKGMAFISEDAINGKKITIVGEKHSFVYCHCSKFLVTNKQMVAEGMVIGLSGNTGRSTGPHLHFAVYDHQSKKYINPINVIG